MSRSGSAPRRRVERPRAPAVSAAGRLPWVRLAMMLVVAFALALRLWGVRHGLPDFLDEAIPFRKALGMWDPMTGAIDWNPRFFHYPSLTLYLHLLLQQGHLALGRALGWFAGAPDYVIGFQTDPTPMVIPARVLSIAFGALAIGGAALIGERLRRGAGLLAALMLAAAPTLIESARTIQSDTVMAALAVLAVERMLAWQARGGAWRLAIAVVLVGLAAGAKYPGVALLLPLAMVMGQRQGLRGLAGWPLAVLGAAAVFLLTTPFALLDRAAFARDLGFVGGIAASGHFGDLERAGFAFQARTLVRDLGLMTIAMVAAGVVLLALERRVRMLPPAVAAGAPPAPSKHALADRAVVWACALAFGVPIAVARVEAERYLVPVLPFVALLAADGALGLAALARGRARSFATVGLGALLVVPVLGAGLRAAGRDPYASRIEARRWLERHLGPHDLLLQEGYAAPVMERVRAAELRASAVFQAGSSGVRQAYEARPQLAAVSIPLAVVGTTSTTVQPRGGPPVTLTVVPHPADLNQAVYDPRLLDGVDFVVTSSAVRGRFEADAARYPVPLQLYALLDSAAEVAARFGTADGSRGPRLTVYRMGERARAAVAAHGPLPPLWWTERLSPGYRVAYEQALLPPERRGGGALVDLDGEPREWVQSLRGLFTERYASFAQWLSMELMERGRPLPARQLAAAVATMQPDDVVAALTYVDASIQVGEWGDALRALERVERALGGGGAVPGLVRLQRAGILLQLGDSARARDELELASVDPDPAIAARAARALGRPR